MARKPRGSFLEGAAPRHVETREAAERAGASVSAQVSEMVDAAQSRAKALERDAGQTAARAHAEAHEQATGMLETVANMERELSAVLRTVSQEADTLRATIERRRISSAARAVSAPGPTALGNGGRQGSALGISPPIAEPAAEEPGPVTEQPSPAVGADAEAESADPLGDESATYRDEASPAEGAGEETSGPELPVGPWAEPVALQDEPSPGPVTPEGEPPPEPPAAWEEEPLPESPPPAAWEEEELPPEPPPPAAWEEEEPPPESPTPAAWEEEEEPPPEPPAAWEEEEPLPEPPAPAAWEEEELPPEPPVASEEEAWTEPVASEPELAAEPVAPEAPDQAPAEPVPFSEPPEEGAPPGLEPAAGTEAADVEPAPAPSEAEPAPSSGPPGEAVPAGGEPAGTESAAAEPTMPPSDRDPAPVEAPPEAEADELGPERVSGRGSPDPFGGALEPSSSEDADADLAEQARARVYGKDDLELAELYNIATVQAESNQRRGDERQAVYWSELMSAAVAEAASRPAFGEPTAEERNLGRRQKKRRSKQLKALAAARSATVSGGAGEAD